MSEEQQIINNESMRYIVPPPAPGQRRGRDATDVQATIDRVKRSFIPTQTEQDESINVYNEVNEGQNQKAAATLECGIPLGIYVQNQNTNEDENEEYHLQYESGTDDGLNEELIPFLPITPLYDGLQRSSAATESPETSVQVPDILIENQNENVNKGFKCTFNTHSKCTNSVRLR